MDDAQEAVQTVIERERESLPPIPCAGECGQMLRTRFVRDYCDACALKASREGKLFPRPPLRVA